MNLIKNPNPSSVVKIFSPAIFILLMNIISCSSSYAPVKQIQVKEPEILIFEEKTKPDSAQTVPLNSTVIKREEKKEKDSLSTVSKKMKYYIQVGVFTSRERAESFIKENQTKSAYLMNFVKRESDKNFIVRFKPFVTREEAESVKNSIRQIPQFKDAFIIVEE